MPCIRPKKKAVAGLFCIDTHLVITSQDTCKSNIYKSSIYWVALSSVVYYLDNFPSKTRHRSILLRDVQIKPKSDRKSVWWLSLLQMFLLKFCTGWNPARVVLQISNNEKIWQWPPSEIRRKAFRWSTILKNFLAPSLKGVISKAPKIKNLYIFLKRVINKLF